MDVNRPIKCISGLKNLGQLAKLNFSNDEQTVSGSAGAKSRVTCLHPLRCAMTRTCREKEGGIFSPLRYSDARKNSSAPVRPGVIPEHHFYGSVLRHNEADGKPRATQCPLLSHRARDALTLRFLVFVNRATVGQATGGNANDTSALKSEIKICHATECEGIF